MSGVDHEMRERVLAQARDIKNAEAGADWRGDWAYEWASVLLYLAGECCTRCGEPAHQHPWWGCLEFIAPKKAA